MITETDIRDMQALYVQTFGLELSDEDARKKLSLLVRQMELIYQPITAVEHDSIGREYEDSNGDKDEQSKDNN